MIDDWVSAIESLPGVAKAFTSLVGEVGRLGTSLVHIGTVKLERISKTDEAHTKADLKIIEAKAFAQVTEIKERTKLHRLSKDEREQLNREAVTKLAIEGILKDPPKEKVAREPTDDWLNLFGEYAQRATSETMRQHWAYILEREIRGPGKFAFATLQLASLLDKEIATCIKKICAFSIVNHYIPAVNILQSGELFQDLLDLVSVGFLNMSTSGYIELPLTGEITKVQIEGVNFEVSRDAAPYNMLRKIKNGGEIINLPVYFLTTAGRELLPIVDVDRDARFGPEVAALLAANNFPTRYGVGSKMQDAPTTTM